MSFKDDKAPASPRNYEARQPDTFAAYLRRVFRVLFRPRVEKGMDLMEHKNGQKGRLAEVLRGKQAPEPKK